MSLASTILDFRFGLWIVNCLYRNSFKNLSVVSTASKWYRMFRDWGDLVFPPALTQLGAIEI
jgi:hypothetical protein